MRSSLPQLAGPAIWLVFGVFAVAAEAPPPTSLVIKNVEVKVGGASIYKQPARGSRGSSSPSR